MDENSRANRSVFLELTPPDKEDVKISPIISKGAHFDRGEPPHGQHEWTIDPATLVDRIPAEARRTSTTAETPKASGRSRYTARSGRWPARRQGRSSAPGGIQIVETDAHLVMCNLTATSVLING
jgi:hypothetical protein